MYHAFNPKTDDHDTMKNIISSKHSEDVKRILLNKMYNVTVESIEEYQKALNWIDTVLSIPTEIKSSNLNIKQSIINLDHKLRDHLHGMDKVIKQILQAVCTILSDPMNEGYILTLVGPPGVGKTTISSLIAEAIGMGFGQISCGSIADQATIVGHGSTYIGSKPGVFTQCLINNGQLDNVILLDEMDKMPDSKILPMLLHVLDRSQNNRFKDAFCPEIDVDLSKNLYIVAVNSLDCFDEALKDRLKIVQIDGYDIEEKVDIVVKHTIPRLIAKTSINVQIDPKIIRQCINVISPSLSGVRDLERFFGDIYEKLLLIKHMGAKLFDLPGSFDVNKIQMIDMVLIKKLSNIKI
jgi:ATP-dependent Lon protease